MLISLYLVKYLLKHFYPLEVMHWKNLVCLCRRTVSLLYIIFNAIHCISGMNNICKFQDNWRIFTRVFIHRQTNRMNKHFSSLLKNVKKWAKFVFDCTKHLELNLIETYNSLTPHVHFVQSHFDKYTQQLHLQKKITSHTLRDITIR